MERGRYRGHLGPHLAVSGFTPDSVFNNPLGGAERTLNSARIESESATYKAKFSPLCYHSGSESLDLKGSVHFDYL